MVTSRRVRDILWILTFAGLTATVLRFFRGLGAVTALSDQLPWGIWKIGNMVAGVALSTGGFVFAGAVHVFRIRKLEPLLRPAILVACLGYASSCFALFLDIGRPFRIWHPIVQWNFHSFLFEVAWCVMLYFTVTLIEVVPIVLERRPGSRLVRFLATVSPIVVITGVTLSALHHTTLGSIFLVSPTRLHPLWYTPFLPLHFILSAMGAGVFSVVLVTLIVAHFYGREPPVAPLHIAAGVGAAILGLYLLTKGWDLASRHAFGLLFTGSWESGLWFAEILGGVLVPIVITISPALRRRRAWLLTAAAFAVGGLLLNRLDVGIFGFFRSARATYVPAPAEIAIALGIPAATALAYLAFVERFRVFPFVTRERPSWAGFERISLLFVVTVAVSGGLFTLPPRARAEQGVAPPREQTADARIFTIDGDRNGEGVRFPHRLHSDLMGGEASCHLCHHLQRPGEEVAPCYECHASMTRPHEIFDHALHIARIAAGKGFPERRSENRTCRECHPVGRVESRETARVCSSCHAGERWAKVSSRAGLAPAFVDAMHGLCGKCHDVKPGGRCAVCHTGRVAGSPASEN